MKRDSITFRIDTAKREALDALAEQMDRDRSYLLNQAVDLYLEVHRWQVEHITEGLRQADAGEFAAEAEAEERLRRLSG
jgi:predicted transcriptional regulator